MCNISANSPHEIASLLDGHQSLDVWMNYGSGHIESIDVAITGTPA